MDDLAYLPSTGRVPSAGAVTIAPIVAFMSPIASILTFGARA